MLNSIAGLPNPILTLPFLTLPFLNATSLLVLTTAPAFFLTNHLLSIPKRPVSNPHSFSSILSPVPQFKVATTTNLGYPSGLKELRSGSDLRVELDRVLQAILRTTCTDGFQAGFQAGLQMALRANKKSEDNRSGSRGRNNDSDAGKKSAKTLLQDLETCSQVTKSETCFANFFFSAAIPLV